MPIKIATTRQRQADHYGTGAGYVGVCTGDPGTGTTPANEASGAGPLGTYARKSFTWTAGTGGNITGAATALDLPAGTYTHMTICTTASGATQYDWALIVKADGVTPDPITLPSGGGQVVITPRYVQT